MREPSESTAPKAPASHRATCVSGELLDLWFSPEPTLIGVLQEVKIFIVFSCL